MMAKFNRTHTMIEAQYKEIADVSAVLSGQKKESAEAIASTTDRDAKLEALADWMSDFIGIARTALKSKPEELKKNRFVIVKPNLNLFFLSLNKGSPCSFLCVMIGNAGVYSWGFFFKKNLPL